MEQEQKGNGEKQLMILNKSENKPINPFTIQKDKDIYTYNENEKIRKKNKTLLLRSKKNSNKTKQISNRLKFRNELKKLNEQIDIDFEKEIINKENKENGTKTVKNDANFTLKVTKDRTSEKESLGEYIKQKRDMFLVQYLLGVKRDEIYKLERIAISEEARLKQAEQSLEQDAISFDNFLKHSDKHSVEAIRIADKQTKSKLEKHAEIKKLYAQIVAINSEINKQEDILKELYAYKTFLHQLSPSEWQEKNHCDTYEIICDSIDLKNQDALYFKEPQQLINLLSELEETNLSLIQNSQDTEESLKQVKNDMDKSETKMNEETNCLKQNIGILKEKINIEEIRSTRLKRFIDEYSSIGDEKSNVEDRTNILQQLHTEVENVYKNCVGEGNEASINTIQMLTNIENKLEKMFEIIECLPYEMVISAEKIKEKERRLFLRQEKILTQKKHQEERIQKALERAKAAPKKLTGRRVIERSNPPIIQKLNQEDNEEILRLQQELAYYFVE